MPRPLYIVCSESAAIDQDTNRASLFNVVEGLQVTVVPKPSGEGVAFVKTLDFRGIAVWMRNEDDDPEDEYEFELAARAPGDADENVFGDGKFKFTKRLHRFNVLIGVHKPWTESGMFVFTSRIRRVGTSEWLSQEFPILVDVTKKIPANQLDGVEESAN